jgi:hypothetical protein
MNPARWLRIIVALGSVFLAVFWIAFLGWGRHLAAADWARILPGFALAETTFGPVAAARVPQIVGLFLVLVTGLFVAAVVATRFSETFSKPELRARMFRVAMAAAAVCVLFEQMVSHSYYAPWYKIEEMMTNPAAVPVFGQRLLLIWPAAWLKYLVPRLNYIQAFLTIQALAMVVAVYVMGQWAARFVGPGAAFLGQVFLTVLLIPTFVYHTAHDIGVVVTYTLCLLFLYDKKYIYFVIAFFLGVLNHQNILLMIPTACVILWGRERRSTIGWLAVSTLAIYFGTRAVLNATVPIPQDHEIKVWWNIRQIVEMHRTMVFALLDMLPWYVAGAVAFRSADPFLKRAAVLFPMQYAVFFLFGQVNEVRIFNGFLPVLIGIFLCYVRESVLVRTASPQLAHVQAVGTQSQLR